MLKVCEFRERGHVSRYGSRSRVCVISHYACQDAQTWNTSPGDAPLCVRATETRSALELLCCCLALLCLIYQRLCPGSASPSSESTRMHLKERFVRALILIDMLSGDEYFAPQCPSAPEWLRTSPFSTPFSCVYRGGSQSVARGPPAVALTASQVGAWSLVCSRFRIIQMT